MSQQGLQQTHQLLQVINSQLPSIAQASETPGVDLMKFIYGAVSRAGIPQENPLVGPFIASFAALIGPPTPQPIIAGAELPVMDGAG